MLRYCSLHALCRCLGSVGGAGCPIFHHQQLEQSGCCLKGFCLARLPLSLVLGQRELGAFLSVPFGIQGCQLLQHPVRIEFTAVEFLCIPSFVLHLSFPSHLSVSSWVCFISNVQTFQLYFMGGQGKAPLLNLSGNRSLQIGFEIQNLGDLKMAV